MAADAIEDDLARRFRIDRPPTLLARKSSKARIGFSRMRSSRPTRGRSVAVRNRERLLHSMFRYRCRFSRTYGRQDGAEKCPICVSAMHSWLTSATIRSSVWISLSIRFAFTSRRLRLMRWPNEAGIRRVKGLYCAKFWCPRFGHVRSGASARRRDGATGRRNRDVFRLYRARFFRSHCARLRGRPGRGTERPRRPRGVAAAARPRLHQRQFGTTILRSRRSRMSADYRASYFVAGVQADRRASRPTSG